MQDALAFGGAVHFPVEPRRSGQVACLAQLVNVIAPILTDGRSRLAADDFYPFPHMSRYGHGTVLRTVVRSASYASRYMDPRGKVEHWFDIPAAPYIKLAAVHDEQVNGLSLFVLNRHLQERITLDVAVRGIVGMQVVAAEQLHDGDLNAINSKEQPGSG